MRYFLVLALVALAGCDLFGAKSDPTTDDIFDEGRSDPSAVDVVGYVAVQPFFQASLAPSGRLDAPTDVAVGFDEFVYVTDAQGLHVLDRAGRPQAFVGTLAGQPLREASAVVQDRRFHVYVTALRDTTVEGRQRRLPVVYHLSGLTTGAPAVEDVIWHPFDDLNRRLILRQPQDFDEQVRFTGVAVLADNRIYVSRMGPVGGPVLSQLPAPLNTIMLFSPDGANITNVTALSGTRPSLTSSVNPTAVLTRVQPPQQSGFLNSLDFFVAQSPFPLADMPAGTEQQRAVSYPVLSIRVVETSDGISYLPNIEYLAAAQGADTTRGRRFLYTPYRFLNPSGLAYAADGTGYLFVTDTGTDSLYVFNANGIEGVAPPPGSRDARPVVVSFGGQGAASLQFRDPSGVAYFRRTVYVADRGNNRISRFRLNTDLE